MKVQRELSIYVGGNTRAADRQALEEKESQRSNGKSVFAGDISGMQDRILMKQQAARKKALKVVTDAWNGDRKIDDGLKERREKVKSLQDEIGSAKKELSELAKQQEDLRQVYGVEADSEEQKELELLLKEREAKRNPEITLTKEELEQLSEMSGKERTEYQSRVLEMDSSGDYYRNIISDGEKEMKAELRAIRETEIDRLKKSPMLKAQKEAEEIEEAAGEEILGMLIEEGKEHLDEEQEKIEEQAEKVEEKKEEQEEVLDLHRQQDDMKKEIKNIVDKLKLTEEDIKGVAVDEIL